MSTKFIFVYSRASGHMYFYFISGLIAVVGQCLPSYYCPVGSKSATEVICTAGYYCPLGTETPSPCPAGRYSDVQGLSMESQCSNCTEGYYCETTGMTNVTGPCKEGMTLNRLFAYSRIDSKVLTFFFLHFFIAIISLTEGKMVLVFHARVNEKTKNLNINFIKFV